jgi:hypothetical protein
MRAISFVGPPSLVFVGRSRELVIENFLNLSEGHGLGAGIRWERLEVVAEGGVFGHVVGPFRLQFFETG